MSPSVTNHSSQPIPVRRYSTRFGKMVQAVLIPARRHAVRLEQS